MVPILLILGGVVVLLAVVLGYAATRPDAFRVERTARIQAPAENLFALINDFHSWKSWSPWEKLDPGIQKTYSGAASGKGAVYEWEGNKQVGKGRMEITESSRPSRIRIQLDFFKPFEAHNTAEFTLKAQGKSTDVTWAMDGRKPYLFKLMSLFCNMDKMIGKDFETGLANLRGLTESPAGMG